jgi:hypothetical protein
MNILIPLVTSAVSLLALQMDGMDMAVAEKWSNAKVIKYHAVGLHKSRELVVFGDYEGKADVTDTITVEFTWDKKSRKFIGPVTVIDGKSVLTNIKSDGTNCGPPTLKGEYEYFQYVSHAATSGGQIQLNGIRVFPPAMVSNYPGSCSMSAIVGGKEPVITAVGGTSPEVLGMPIMKEGVITTSPDRKTFSVGDVSGWKWTYTPTLVQ